MFQMLNVNCIKFHSIILSVTCSSGSRILSRGGQKSKAWMKIPEHAKHVSVTEGSPSRHEVWGLPRALEALGFFVAVYAFSCFSEHHFPYF